MNNSSTRHLTDDELQLLADGEMDDRSRAKATSHLSSCWSCRGRLVAHEGTLTDLALAQERYWETILPPVATGRSQLAAKLRRRRCPRRRPPFWTGWTRVLRAPVWTAALVTALSLILVVGPLVSPQSASASMLLERAIESTKSATEIRGVELRISVNGKQYRQRRVRRNNISGWRLADVDVGLPILPSLPVLSWDNPLAADAFQEWRQNLTGSSDEIVRQGATILLTTTDLGSDPVHFARITLRSSDYWPVAKQVSLRDGTTIEVEQISASTILREADLNREISARLPHSAGATATEPDKPLTPAELAEGEAQVLLALHKLGADMGEEIVVKPSGSQITVEGRVSTSERKLAIVSELSALNNMRINLKSFEELSSRRVHARPGPAIAFPQAETSEPALSEWISRNFPAISDRVRYVNSTFALADSAAQHGYALERLAKRFSHSRLMLLSPSIHAQILTMAKSHEQAISRASSELTAALQPLLQNDTIVAVPGGGTWQGDAIDAAKTTRDLQETVVASFTGGAQHPMEPKSAVAELSIHLSRLDKLLERVRQALQTPDLQKH